MSEPAPRPPAVGDLLVATPILLDPNFERTVVLLLDIDENGALGVVLNRPSPVPVVDVLPDWEQLATSPHVLFQGGPVSTDSALAVGTLGAELAPVTHEEPVGFRRLYGDVGIVDLDTPTVLAGPVISRLRVFAGYAGWSEQQLLAEIAGGSWYVVPSLPGDLFDDEPRGLWARVLRRQPGELSFVSTRPLDPTLN
jgi:putative transcriptional regulator